MTGLKVSKTGAPAKQAPRKEPHRGPVSVHAKSSKGCSLSYPKVRSGGKQADVGAQGATTYRDYSRHTPRQDMIQRVR